MTARRITVVLNPGSGKGEGRAGPDELCGMLAAQGAEVHFETLEKGVSIDELVKRGLQRDSDIVVAAGGDGTICGVAEAMAGSGVPMGILARGTFNYFARSLDLPQDEGEAVEVILTGTARPVRTGRINGKLFLNNTSVGRYPEILANREGIYKRWGRSRVAAYWSVLTTLLTLRRPLELRIDADGAVHTLRTPLIFVLNNAFQMEQMGLDGQEALAEGKLVMYLSPDTGRFGLLRQALALAVGVAQEGRDFQILAAEHFDIQSRRRSSHRVALDGERLRLDAPLSISAKENELHVIAPETATAQRDIR